MNRNQSTAGAKTAPALQRAAVTPSVESKRQLQVHEEIDLLIATTNELESAVNVLTARLAPVTNVASATGENGEEKLDSCRVPMADTIREQRQRIQQLTDRLMLQVEWLEL